jgi:succinate dehydrogenase/fumarate reductase flavoprotein subunit
MATLNAVTAWHLEVDVIVVGAGLAGCVTAVAAREADPTCDVLVVDKLSATMHGGASRCAAQYLNCPSPASESDLMDYQRALNLPWSIPESLLQTWAHAVCNNREWIAASADLVGRELVHRFDRPPDFPDLPGASCVEAVWSIGLEGESGVWKTFRERVDRLEIPVMTEAPAFELVQDADTLEVFGVLVRHEGEVLALRARRGVALCLGGFAANLDMMREYVGYEAMHTLGCPANTGDGILMLQRAGAALWHMRGPGAVGGITPGIKVDEYPSAFIRDHLTVSSFIDVAADDRRFYDETADYEATHFKELRHGHWRDTLLPEVLPVHMIFDERARVGQQLGLDWAGWNAIAEGYRWSADNAVEVDRGWIRRADTIGELAELIGRDPAALQRTVDDYNAACAAGHDAEYGRDAERLVPIEQGPFYAVGIVPAIPGSTAGARRDEHSRVVSTAGTPIPRLYEAGELGSTLANLYQNGSLLTEAIAFGRIAGTNLAAESPAAVVPAQPPKE